MTTSRLVIQGGGGSPVRLAASGDAGSAGFSDLLFDANQAPLRVMQTGYVDVQIVQYGNGVRTNPFNGSGDIPLAVPPPAGRYNLFTCITRTMFPSVTSFGLDLNLTPSGANGNPFAGGHGAITRPTVFNALNFDWDGQGTLGYTYTRFHYAIFRNY